MRTARLRLAFIAALATLFTMTGTPLPAAAADPTAAIKGVVLSFMDPLGFARVTVFNADTGTALKSVVADVGGNYLVTGLPAGRVQVRATKTGYLTSWADNAPSRATARIYTLSPGQVLEQSWDPPVLSLDLAPEAVVTGTVLGVSDVPLPGTGTPVAGASVTVLSEDGRGLGHAVTDATGGFRVGMLPSGLVRVRASAAGYLTALAPNNPFGEAQSFPLMAGATTGIGLLRLYAPAVIVGEVRSGTGPIVGTAQVKVLDAVTGKTLRSLVTDSGGGFRVDNLPPVTVRLKATADGYLAGSSGPYPLGPGVETGVVLELTPAGVVTGSVCSVEFIDDLGVVSPCVPQGGVKVTVVSADTGATLASGVTQDISGSFRIGGLPEGRVQVKAVAPGWLTAWAPDVGRRVDAKVFDVRPGTPTDVGTVTLYEPATVYVDVLWNMDPIPGTATLTLVDTSTNKVVRTVQTAAGGVATRLGDLRPGSYRVRAVADGFLPRWSGTFTLLPGQVLGPEWARGCIVLPLELEGVITGNVMGFGAGYDDPVPGAKVVAVDATTGKVLGSATTSAEVDHYGDFRIAGLPHTTVRLKVTAPTFLTSWAPGRRTAAEAEVYTVHPVLFGEATDVGVVAIFRPATIIGQVVSAGAPVELARVTVFDAATGAALRSVTTDADGRYRVEGLWTGWSLQVKVRALKDGYITNWADSDVQRTMATATVFPLGPGDVLEQTGSGLPSLYLEIAREAVVQGQVLGNFDPLDGATVTVVDAITGKALRSAVSDVTGAYRIGGIDAWGGRQVKVRASKAGWRTSWADGAWTQGTARVFGLHPGTVLTQSWDPMVLYLDLQKLA